MTRGGARLIEVPRKAMLKLLATDPAVAATVDRFFMLRFFQGYLFPAVDERLLWQLVDRATVEAFDKDQVVFREGDAGDAFFLIRSGQVKISKASAGRERVLSYLVAGNSFGETALLPARCAPPPSRHLPTELIRLGATTSSASSKPCRSCARDRRPARGAAYRIAAQRGGSDQRSVLSDLIHARCDGGRRPLHRRPQCVRCGNCIAACEGVHEDARPGSRSPAIKLYNLLAPTPVAVRETAVHDDCPPTPSPATPRRGVHQEQLIGCGNCSATAPTQHLHGPPAREPRRLRLARGLLGFDGGHAAAAADDGRTVAVKCDLCARSRGPACVRSCPTGAALRLEPGEYQARLAELVVKSEGR